MSVAWLAPMGLVGLALVAIPIAIHLLVRQQSRRVAFPSLRFLRPSQLAAWRRRNIQDVVLLACRAAVIAAAALALAGPVIESASRSAASGARMARAVIIEPGTAASVAAEAASGAFVSKTFTRHQIDDAIADARRWLDVQPPASREVVFVGAFRRGSVTQGDLRGVPSSAGIRFVIGGDSLAGRDRQWPVLRSVSAGLVIEQRHVHFENDSTRVTSGSTAAAASDLVRIVAAPADQPLADAALRVALAEGLRWQDSGPRLLIAWDGADEAMVQRLLGGATLLRMERPAPVSTAATAVTAAVEQVTAATSAAFEPVRISAAQLQAWSRPPGGVPANAPLTDQGDRRWLWALVLALLTIEHSLRRPKVMAVATEPVAEARVA